jgi:hypothetical protein
MGNLDSIMKFYDKPQLIQKLESSEHYRLNQKNGKVEQVDIVFDLHRDFLAWVSYRTDDGQLVVIHFNKFEKSPRLNPMDFKDETYFVRRSEGVVASAAYRGYNVSVVTP